MTKIVDELTRNDGPRFLSYQQFANARGVSIDTVKRQVKRGEIESISLSPRRKGIPVSELMKSV